jgi:hypothetical protein
LIAKIIFNNTVCLLYQPNLLVFFVTLTIEIVNCFSINLFARDKIMLLLGLIGAALAVSNAIPSEWQAKVQSLNAFYASNDTDPIESNGYPGIYLV